MTTADNVLTSVDNTHFQSAVFYESRQQTHADFLTNHFSVYQYGPFGYDVNPRTPRAHAYNALTDIIAISISENDMTILAEYFVEKNVPAETILDFLNSWTNIASHTYGLAGTQEDEFWSAIKTYAKNLSTDLDGKQIDFEQYIDETRRPLQHNIPMNNNSDLLVIAGVELQKRVSGDYPLGL